MLPRPSRATYSLAAALLVVAPATVVTAGILSPVTPTVNWGIAKMGFNSVSATGDGIYVAVIEDGFFDRYHADYDLNVSWCISLDSTSTASTACHDGSLDPDDPLEAHATHVAGIVHQVAPDASLYLIRAQSTSPLTPFQRIGEALRLASLGKDGVAGTSDDAEVAVLSLTVIPAPGGVTVSQNAGTMPGFGISLAQTQVSRETLGNSHPLAPVLPEQLVPSGMTVVAAAGNLIGYHEVQYSAQLPLSAGLGPGTIAFPASHPDVIAVGSLGGLNVVDGTVEEDYMSEFSAAGAVPPDVSTLLGAIDVVAPGMRILSSVPGGGQDVLSGTSQAAPHVAGLAALYYDSASSPSPAGFRSALECGSQDLSLQGGYTVDGPDLSSGFGLPWAPSVLSSTC